jgi:ketosteroid isomerase-like protein
MSEQTTTEEATRAVVTRWFDALDGGNIDAAMACLDDHVRWINSPGEEGKPGGVPGLSAIVPWLGDFSSKADVIATFGPYAERQETVRYERLNMMFRDDQAMVLVHEVARIRATGLLYDIEFVQRIQVARDKIILLRAYWDTSRAVAAFRGDMPSRLRAAARSGDTSAALLILPFGANPNQVEPASADSALMIAAREGHVEMVAMLLSYGAEPNLVGRVSGGTALHEACRAGEPAALSALLAAGAFVDLQRPTTGETPLHEALRYPSPECAEILLDAGASTRVLARDGKSPRDIALATLGQDAPILARLA